MSVEGDVRTHVAYVASYIEGIIICGRNLGSYYVRGSKEDLFADMLGSMYLVLVRYVQLRAEKRT